MEYIRIIRIATGTLKHERENKRSRRSTSSVGKTQRKMLNGIACVVPEPQKRTTLVKDMHRYNGHSRLQDHLTHCWWVGLGKNKAYVIVYAEL